ILHPSLPLTLSGAALDQAAVGQASATANAFHAGTDWRTPDWKGPDIWVGYSGAGDYRTTEAGATGERIDAPGEWLTAAQGDRADEPSLLADGWSSVGGDWQPASPQYPEPRWDGSPDSKFRPRFPDATFSAVRQAIAPMRLGLWMSPTFFNPNSKASKDHPDWTCQPVGQALSADNQLDPNSGSNEAGIVPWNKAAFPYVESRIRDAIDNWGVTYFKFDF